ncbi:hypothetical protein BS50DRAFT_648655 [Corynespora cassiicola Philippines]|uniref:Uncharacterized protein n=1 Tax=Corynespora cassiicola Philippines TaxID=1448308 RepID=A0A2T2NCS6_CORCC|nr:hypothetical protein BS50DRAFT_648655 [Corynespora cassiicola Philippines]
MNFRILKILLFAFFSSGTVIATLSPPLPQPNPDSSLAQKREEPGINGNIGGVYMCDKEGFEGECMYMRAPMGQDKCKNLEEEWWNRIASFGPDKSVLQIFEFRCKVFNDVDCKGWYNSQTFPGTGINYKSWGKSVRCEFIKDGAQEWFEEVIKTIPDY